MAVTDERRQRIRSEVCTHRRPIGTVRVARAGGVMLGTDTDIAALEIENDFKTINSARVLQNTGKRSNARGPVPLKACRLNLHRRHDPRHCVNDAAREFANGDRRSGVTSSRSKNGRKFLRHRIKPNAYRGARSLDPSEEPVGSIDSGRCVLRGVRRRGSCRRMRCGLRRGAAGSVCRVIVWGVHRIRSLEPAAALSPRRRIGKCTRMNPTHHRKIPWPRRRPQPQRLPL